MNFKKKLIKKSKNSSKINNQINLNQNDQSRSNEDSIKAVAMIRSYRQRGHLIAKLDPSGIA